MRIADDTSTSVVAGSLHNTTVDGGINGFCFDIRITNGRGCFLSIINGFYVSVDGTVFRREEQRLAVNGKSPRSLDELKCCSEEHWDVRDKATLYIEKEGGIAQGMHQVIFETRLLDGYFKAQDYWLTDPPELDTGAIGEPYILELVEEEIHCEI